MVSGYRLLSSHFADKALYDTLNEVTCELNHKEGKLTFLISPVSDQSTVLPFYSFRY